METEKNIFVGPGSSITNEIAKHLFEAGAKTDIDFDQFVAKHIPDAEKFPHLTQALKTYLQK